MTMKIDDPKPMVCSKSNSKREFIAIQSQEIRIMSNKHLTLHLKQLEKEQRKPSQRQEKKNHKDQNRNKWNKNRENNNKDE